MKNKNLCLLAAIILITLLSSVANSSYPPTATKVSGDTNYQTTFNFDFSNFTGTRSGTNLSLGVLGISGGGTGQTTATSAINALLPSQGGNNGKFLQTDGTNTSWVTGGVSSQWVTSGSNIYYDTGNVGVGTSSPSSMLHVSQTNTATSGTNIATRITPTYNQASGTAANTDFLINRTETAVGSGAQLLFDAQVGGTSKFKVDNGGSLTSAGNINFTSGTGHVGFHAVSLTPTSQNFYGLVSNTATASLQIAAAPSLNLYIDAGSSANYGSHIFRKTAWDGSARTYTESMRLDSSGNLGIGTASPTQKLDVRGSIGVSNSSAGGEVFNFGIGTTSQMRMNLQSVLGFQYGTISNTNYGQLTIRDGFSNSYPAYSFINDANTGISNAAGTADTLNFITGGSERMRIDSSGNIGFGTTSPSTYGFLSVLAPSQSTGLGTLAAYSNDTGGAADLGGNITFGGNDGVTAARTYAEIRGRKENGTSGNYSSYLSFVNRANGGSLTEKMRIDSSGNVGIGTTSPNSLLTVNGPISTAIVSKTSATYNITATDSVILMAATSGTQSVTLPTAVGCAGRQYIIKRTATGGTSYTIATTSSQTIDGSTTAALSAQYQSIIVVSDGANWFIL